MIRSLALTLLVVLAAPGWAAEEPRDAEPLARAVAPYIHARTFGLVHVDLARLDLPALLRWLEEQKLEQPQQPSPLRELAAFVEPLRRAGVQHVGVVLDLDVDIYEMPPVVITLEPKASSKGVATVLRGLLMMTKSVQLEEHDSYLVVAGANTLKRMRPLKRVERPEVARVLSSREGGAHHFLLFPPSDLRRSLEEMITELPPEVGSSSIRPVTRGLRWLALGVDLPPKPRLSLTIQAANEGSARALQGILGRGLPLWIHAHSPKGNWPGLDKILTGFQLQADGNRLRWELGGKEGTALLLETLQQMRGALEEQEAANQFRQILIAFHNYVDSHKRLLPPAVFTDKAGKQLLSWRVHLLPYIEQADLYKQFHLDEPWDSEHNKKLISRMPKVYASPSRPELARQGKTTYLVPLGKDLAFPGSTGLRFPTDFADGTSNTILLVDADRAVIWTQPDDLPIDLDNPSKGLTLSVRKKYMVGMADGSVRFLQADISKPTLRAAFTRSGGEILGPDW